MIHIGMFLLTYTALVCQTSLGDLLTFNGIAPDFLALVAIVSAFSLKGSSAIFWAALAGLMADCLVSTHLGISMLLSTLTACLVQTMFNPDWRNSAYVQTVLGSVILFSLIMGASAARILLSGHPTDVSGLLLPALQTAIYSSLCGLLISRVWRYTRRFIPRLSTNSSPRSAGNWGLLNR